MPQASSIVRDDETVMRRQSAGSGLRVIRWPDSRNDDFSPEAAVRHCPVHLFLTAASAPDFHWIPINSLHRTGPRMPLPVTTPSRPRITNQKSSIAGHPPSNSYNPRVLLLFRMRDMTPNIFRQNSMRQLVEKSARLQSMMAPFRPRFRKYFARRSVTIVCVRNFARALTAMTCTTLSV